MSGERPTGGESDQFREGRGTAHRASDGESLVRESSHFTKWLYERFADDLRAVIVYDGSVSEYTYLAEHVDAAYTDAALERIADENAFRDALTHPHYESLFHLGGTEATATLFEDATLVQIPFEDETGVVLTVERERTVDVDGLVTAVREDHRPHFLARVEE